MNNVEIIAAHYEASSRGDLEGMVAAFDDDIEWIEMEGSELAGTYRGRDEIVAHVLAPINDHWSDFTVLMDEILDAGAAVVAIGRYSGTNRETGKEMSARVAHVWRLQAGRIVAFEQFADTAQLRAATLP